MVILYLSLFHLFYIFNVRRKKILTYYFTMNIPSNCTTMYVYFCHVYTRLHVMLYMTMRVNQYTNIKLPACNHVIIYTYNNSFDISYNRGVFLMGCVMYVCRLCIVRDNTQHRLLDSLVIECWLRVREVPGSIPSQGPRHTKIM